MVQRGLALSAVAAVLSENGLRAALPAALAENTIKAAPLFAAGPAAVGGISAQVVALTEGVVQAMVLTRIKMTVVVLLAVSFLVSGAGLLAHRTLASESKQQAGNVRYDKDKRTCILPVKLETGKTYAFWLNSAKFGNFKDKDGQSAVPYLLVFETK
jgi:hypothetical protein